MTVGLPVLLVFSLMNSMVPDSRPPRQTIVFKRVDALDIQADVYRPSGSGPFPVILWIHGGALIFGDRSMLPEDQLELYLREGFAIVSIDYRLAPETKLDAILEDVDAAYGWLMKEGPRGGLDPDRVAVVGHSAGGYLTLMAGCRFNPRPAALVSFYGYGDIAGKWYSRPDPYYLTKPLILDSEAWRAVGSTPLINGDEAKRFPFYQFTRQKGIWPRVVTGHDPAVEPRVFDQWCPVRRATHQYPPTMLIHGEKDTDVPVAQSRMMADALRARGVDCRLMTLPGRDHVFDLEEQGVRDPDSARVFRQVIEFLHARLGNPRDRR